MAGELGGRSQILRPTVAQVPAGDITLNEALAFNLSDRRTLGIDIRNPSGGNTVRFYDQFPWLPAQNIRNDSPLLPANGGDVTLDEVLVANLGTNFRSILTGETFHYEHYELHSGLWLMAEGGTQLVEIVLANRQA